MLFRILIFCLSASFISACGSEPNIPIGFDKPIDDGEICAAMDVSEKAEEVNLQNYESFDNQTRTYNTPTRKLELNEWPNMVDDLDFEGMSLAITRQLKRYKSKNLNGYIRMGGKRYPLSDVPKSLERFRQLTDEYFQCQQRNSKSLCEFEFKEDLQEDFDLFMPVLTPDDPRYGEDKQTLFTAYYTPLLRGRGSSDARFPHAVYKNPRKNELLEKTRVDIDFKKAYEKKSLEVFYADDLFDLYLLHVQGGGRVVMENKSGKLESFYISYDGTNGHSWDFISNYMYDKKYIKNKSIAAQRNFLKANPQKQEEIYSTCPSYVYFKKSDHPPLGNDMVSLTDNRSIATDTNYYRFKGMLSFVKARRPKEEGVGRTDDCKSLPYRNFSRFYLDQDTGGAIRGKARVDLYFGEGPYAELAAYNTKERGDLYFLMLK